MVILTPFFLTRKQDNMKTIYAIVLSVMAMTVLQAQSVTEAVRYSFGEPVGTARVAGVGGAFGAMGGDYGVVAINPAGLGEYWKGELSFSPGFGTVNSDAYLNDESSNVTNSTDNTILNLYNLGIVFANRKASGDFQTSNWAIGIHRVANFSERFEYSGYTQGSITERFKELANGKTFDQLDDFEAYPAYWTSAIFDDDDDLQYDSDISDIAFVDKSQIVSRSGRMNELNVSWGGKYKEKFNLGVGLGIPIVRFTENKEYVEWDPGDEIDLFNSLVYRENLTTDGVGINLRVGAQYTMLNFLRLGAVLQSPSYLALEDEYDTVLDYDYTLEPGAEPYESPIGTFEYTMITPWKATLSAGALLKLGNLNGFINADLEYLDYTNARLDFRDVDVRLEDEANDDIAVQLSGATNLRIGGELAYRKIRLRAGSSFLASPYGLDDGNLGATSVNTSFGMGYRGDKFFIDAAWRARQFDEGYLPYRVLDIERNQVVTNEKSISNLIFTLGFKF